MNLKLGRLPRVYNPAVPHMSALRGLAKPVPLPPDIDYTLGMPDDYGMMLNSKLGCCTCAAYYHAMQVWSYNTNKVDGRITQPDINVLQLYKDTCGYNPNNPLSDRGGIEQDVLIYLLNTGAPTGLNGKTRHKIRAFVEVDCRHDHDVKRAIYECGCLYIGFNVPETILNGSSVLWTVDDSPIVGGHAVILAGYDSEGLWVISWGRKFKMTWEFFHTYTDEAYAIADIDFFQANGKTLLGMSMAELKSQMIMLKSNH